MDSVKFHEIWVEQCEAADEIKRRYGTKAAFDYLVAEKLLNFADAATTHPAFARELPLFVARVRSLFTVEEMRRHLNRIECEQRKYDAYIEERDEFDEEAEVILESAVVAAERARRFATIAELLTAAELGTS
jgi:flagellar biosynthesis regulator FlbT